MTTEERIKNRKIGIVGMARSGMAAAVLAQKLGGTPFVSDCGQAELLTAQTRRLDDLCIPFETDAHSDKLLGCDYLILSPGVPLHIDILDQARQKGIPIFSEIEFASWVCQGKIVAVTGSNGKTTTTTLLGEIFSSAGFETYVCGNVGLPFSEVAADVTDDAIAVVEVSTFQLETIADFRPQVAMILNLSPDHLDRHGSFDAYKALKYRITENQGDEDFLILNHNDRILIGDAIETKAQKLYFSIQPLYGDRAFVREDSLFTNVNGEEKRIISTREIKIPGPHNLQNAAAAVSAASVLEVPVEVMAEVLQTFSGVEHRLEKAGSVAGIYFINDSKATNVDSVCYALQSINTPVYLIAGGRDKGGDFTPIANYGKGKIKGIVVIGEARNKIFESLGKSFPVQTAESLQEAVQRCFEIAFPGETVLLSPGCASFDMFNDFEHRGRVFKEAVAGLKNGRRNETINS